MAHRLHDQITDRCLPPGTIGYDACHARHEEDLARLRHELQDALNALTLLTAERDEALKQINCITMKAHLDRVLPLEAERDRLRALLRHCLVPVQAYYDEYGDPAKGREILADLNAVLEGREREDGSA